MRLVVWGACAVSLYFGVLLVLMPNLVTKINKSVSRNIAEFDQHLMRFRHVFGALLLVASYLFFVLGLK